MECMVHLFWLGVNYCSIYHYPPTCEKLEIKQTGVRRLEGYRDRQTKHDRWSYIPLA